MPSKISRILQLKWWSERRAERRGGESGMGEKNIRMKHENGNPGLTGVLIVLRLPLTAQNLLSNPGFDSDILNWDNPYNREAVWDSRDAGDSATSGSALLTNTNGNGGSLPILEQCIEINEGAELNFSAHYDEFR